MKAFTQITVAAAAIGFAHVAQAGSLEKSRVGADSQWLVHLDIQSFAKSQLYARTREQDHGIDIDLQLNEMEEEIGLDPLKDLFDITIYGKGNPEADRGVVAVVTATAAIDNLVDKIKAEAGDAFKVVQSGGYEVSLIQGEDEPVYFKVNTGKNSQERIVVLGLSAEGVAGGLSVLEGKSPSLVKGGDAALTVAPREGSFFYFTGINPGQWLQGMMDDAHDDDDNDDDAHGHADHHEAVHDQATNVLSRTRNIRVELGETAGTMFASAAVVTGNAQDAQDLGDMLQGILAMGRLAAGSEPELKPAMGLIRAVKVSQDDTGIRVDFQSTVDDFMSALKAMEAMDEDADDEDADDDDADDHGHQDHHSSRQPADGNGTLTISASVDREVATLVIVAVARVTDSIDHEIDVDVDSE